ncbi:DsbA family protein [Pontibacter qinzhouensis]|uniref:DsbA family protein n=1 Tax=Pontibacter qinzhouensis TaxID=2603253 RepID=A0A5C8KEL0_9BACT|nr:DsbA family protein [Pontibacter qinzhouensis]TXK51876.1 DsbA family protein [Pontibacter qinzhouensis]
MTTAPQTPTILYVTNPMCAWCYGFTPVMRRLRALWHGRLNIKILIGDMQAYATEPLLASEKERLAVSWHRVQQRVNLPFDYRFFLKRYFVYHTEPVCRALLVVKLLRPVLTLEVLRALHSAFFADGLDLTNPDNIYQVVKLFGISENLFFALYESDEIMEQLEEEFKLAERIGATSFPSVYLETQRGPELLVKGFCDLDFLEDKLLQHLQFSRVSGY